MSECNAGLTQQPRSSECAARRQFVFSAMQLSHLYFPYIGGLYAMQHAFQQAAVSARFTMIVCSQAQLHTLCYGALSRYVYHA